MWVRHRQAGRLSKQHKDGRVIAEIPHQPHDDGGKMQGWLMKGKKWTKLFQGTINKSNENEMGNYDDLEDFANMTIALANVQKLTQETIKNFYYHGNTKRP